MDTDPVKPVVSPKVPANETSEEREARVGAEAETADDAAAKRRA